MRRRIAGIAALALATAAGTPAHATHDRDTAQYNLAGEYVYVAPGTAPGQPAAWLGGHQFAPHGEDPIRVEIYDASGENKHVGFVACQNTDGDSDCGDTASGEPRVSGCGGADLHGFSGTRATLVYVLVKPLPGDVPCSDPGTRGSIALIYQIIE